jgi:hypothetical protein
VFFDVEIRRGNGTSKREDDSCNDRDTDDLRVSAGLVAVLRRANQSDLFFKLPLSSVPLSNAEIDLWASDARCYHRRSIFLAREQ